MTVTFLIVLQLFSNLITLSHASEFLKPPSKVSERVSEEDIRVSLLDEVEGSLGRGIASVRLSQIEATLRPIVAALQKNAHGNLENSAVNYALHRLFVLRHGWVIKGLTTTGETAAQNSSSAAGILKEQVPAYITGLFEQRLAGKGIGLRELAILAATIEHLIHNEAVSKLGATFDLLGLSVTSALSRDEVTEVLDTYMMTFIIGSEGLPDLTKETARAVINSMPEIFLAWKDTQKYVDGIRKSVIKDELDGVNFASVAKIIETAGEEFGTFQNFECQDMMDKLNNVEYHGTGRVMLSDFYRPAVDSNASWSFTESPDYLRNIGALDESDPNKPSVMIANYVYAPSNCIGPSGFYAVCCKNECEGLLGHLEETIGAPEAKPATITSLISNLPSRTVSAPRKLSAALTQRLDDIAATHSGAVPLHGRLFAQWMHHVYPRECPYPHITGTISPLLPEEWQEVSGNDGVATKEEMKEHVTRAAKFTHGDLQGDLAVEDLMPWSPEEELIVSRPVITEQSASPMSTTLRSIALLAVSSSFAYGMIHTLRKASAHGSGAPLGNEKYLV